MSKNFCCSILLQTNAQSEFNTELPYLSAHELGAMKTVLIFCCLNTLTAFADQGRESLVKNAIFGLHFLMSFSIARADLM